MKKLYIDFQGKKLEAVEQFEFCYLHLAESQIVPDGIINKGYLLEIDFNTIPNRIENLKSDLLDIIKKKVKSFYRENVMRAYREVGKIKANTPMGIMSRFETFQVI